FGMLLRNSEFKGNSSYEHVISAAQAGRGADPFGYRAEFINLVNKARALDNRPTVNTNEGGGIQFK
ncbi:MAG: DUF3520 domain-containing protein, partial [Candidatus Omnitrophica bacterium]|nr:DUF3520 domain-containing protein [Candidatus Omnitrophota bacterium]